MKLFTSFRTETLFTVLPRCTTVTSARQTRVSAVQAQPFEGIPGPKPLPLIGNIWRYFPFIGDYKPETLFENAQFNRKKYGPIVREQLTKNHTILHLFDPDDIESFFRQDGKAPFRRSHRALLKYRKECPEHYRDGGIFPENGDSWLRLRNVFSHYLLNGQTILRRTPILDTMAIDSIKHFEDTRVDQQKSRSITIDNFEQLLQRWSLITSLAVLLDYDVDNMPSETTLERLMNCLHNELEAIDWTEIKSEKWAKKPTKCPFYQRLAESERSLYGFISERILYLERFPSEMRDVSFIKDWLCKDKLHRHDVITFILDSLMASFHTMVYTTTFMLKNISECKPHTYLTLRNEIENNLPSEGLITGDVIDRMPCLKNCLRETLRLNPVSIGTGRLTQHDSTFIRGYKVPKNVMVIAQTQSIGRDEKIFEQAGEFTPERWDEYRRLPRSERPSGFAWLPFGFGPRACIGKQLVKLQICTFVARILQIYSEIEFKKQIDTKTTLIHNIVGNVEIELRKRH